MDAEFGAGFDRSFVGFAVAPPRPKAAIADDLLRVGRSAELRYTHFSLAMSRSRKMARWVAWNVDGGAKPSGNIGREGLSFRPDPRLATDQQIPNSFYEHNPLDRGHVARREDLVWGTDDEARQANADSFFLTNITPQMNTFNESSRSGVWGELENTLLSQERADALRVSLMGGPVLADDDPKFGGYQVPKAFWKVLYYTLNGQPHARGFVLQQDLGSLKQELVAPTDLDLSRYQTYAVDASVLEQQTSLSFGSRLKQTARL